MDFFNSLMNAHTVSELATSTHIRRVCVLGIKGVIMCMMGVKVILKIKTCREWFLLQLDVMLFLAKRQSFSKCDVMRRSTKSLFGENPESEVGSLFKKKEKRIIIYNNICVGRT